MSSAPGNSLHDGSGSDPKHNQTSDRYSQHVAGKPRRQNHSLRLADRVKG